MTDSKQAFTSFDPVVIAREMQDRFGWNQDDLTKAMSTLMRAASSGFKFFGPQHGDLSSLLQPNFFHSGNSNLLNLAAGQDQLAPFFGPSNVRQALAAQVAAMTGLQKDAISEIMPVAATIAFGNMMRPYMQGPAGDMMDAFLRGFARGRPKPQPTPLDYMQQYTSAMQSFWSAFLTPASSTAHVEDEPEADVPEPADMPDNEDLTGEMDDMASQADSCDEDEVSFAGEEEPAPAANEFDAMINNWMSAGREFQSSQMRAFDSFFENATRQAGD